MGKSNFPFRFRIIAFLIAAIFFSHQLAWARSNKQGYPDLDKLFPKPSTF